MTPPFPTAPYVPLREIGRGGHGVVFLAEGPEGRVALKVCERPPEGAGARALEDYEREKRGWALFARLAPHPGLVRAFRTDEAPDGTGFWAAMELADPEEGGSTAEAASYRPRTLAAVAEAEVALPLSDCLRIGERIAGALEHLQRHHLLHRDVKPGNVVFVRGAPALADPGLVADAREADSLVGTPGYAPPERRGSPQGDVFGLGRTLWRIGTGRTPEEAGFSPCAEADTADPDFWRFLAVIGKATSVVPARRHRSAKALRKDLARLRRRRALRPWRRALAALAGLAALASFAFGLSRLGSAAAPAEPDPLDPIREGIRAGTVHLETPDEIRRNVERALAETMAGLDKALEGISQ